MNSLPSGGVCGPATSAAVLPQPPVRSFHPWAVDERFFPVGCFRQPLSTPSLQPASRNEDSKMIRRLLVTVAGVVIPFTLAAVAFAQPGPAQSDDYFADHVYPMLRVAQCRLCHSDTGVGSVTELLFPGPAANGEQIVAFGLQLRNFIDPVDPAQSWLLQKPTNREAHTGGVRIVPGSVEERTLLGWIEYLAHFTAEQHRAADEKISRAQRYQLEPLSIRRLTHSQYNNTVRDLLGDLSRPASRFPKEDFIHGFTNQVAGQGISPLQAEAYSEAAERLAQAAFRGAGPQELLPRVPRHATDPDAAFAFIREFGQKAFRRPLIDEEKHLYGNLLLTEAERTGTFIGGARLVIEAMLQSPHFLYRIERGPSSPYRQYEIASRLSYLLWDTLPDNQLFLAAEQGKLNAAADVEAVARQMLTDPRAQTAFDEFLAQWMRFDRVLAATRDRRRFPSFSEDIAIAMTEETRRLFRHLVWTDQNFLEFFTADYTFVSGALAELYGLPTPSEEFTRVSYPEDSGRAGVLGHGSLLLLTSKPAETSPTSRGLFIRNQFLAQEVPPPPPGTSTELPEIAEDRAMTNRDRLATHLNNESCASCHRLIDPIGFGFEHYDAVGAYSKKIALRFGTRNNARTVELEPDTSAYIQGIADSEFASPKELGKILAENEATHRCIVKQLFRYAFGRQETNNDRPVIDSLLADFRDSGFQFRELIVSLVTSELFLEGGSN
jgi:hypothetical protein